MTNVSWKLGVSSSCGGVAILQYKVYYKKGAECLIKICTNPQKVQQENYFFPEFTLINW